MILIAELATGFGGDLAIAEDMIKAAADAGCTHAKTQAYDVGKLNPRDPQADWLRKSALDKAGHARLMACAEQAGIRYLSTPFDAGSLQMLRDLGLKTFKIASSESVNGWWSMGDGEQWFISKPWGVCSQYWGEHGKRPLKRGSELFLTAIPLYPTPLEAVGRATLLDGWSDHGVGIEACLWAIAQGAKVIEAHLTLGDGQSRVMPFDKTPVQLARIREFADNCQTMRSGVSTQFSERWTA